jgi:hypothetical protein
VSEREREILESRLQAGGFKVPLLLAVKASTQLEVGIGRKALFLYKWQRTVVCCTSRCSEATTVVDTSAGSMVTTTEEGLREGGVFESLSRCWACAESLPREVT